MYSITSPYYLIWENTFRYRKMKTKLLRLVLLLTSTAFSTGCERKMNSENKFVYDFLAENGRQLYKSEMKRTKLDYLPLSQKLVYSFWKQSIFEENGKLFLHLYPKDFHTLPENRREYGFLNIGLGKKDIQKVDSVHFYIIKDISKYANINRIVTGQYVNNKRTWMVDEVLNNQFEQIISEKNETQATSNFNSRSHFVELLLRENTRLSSTLKKSNFQYYISANSDILYLSNIPKELLNEKIASHFYEKKQGKYSLMERSTFIKPKRYCFEDDFCIVSLKIPKGAKRFALMNLERSENKELFNVNLE